MFASGSARAQRHSLMFLPWEKNVSANRITTYSSNGRRIQVVDVKGCSLFGSPVMLPDGSRIQKAYLEPADRRIPTYSAYVALPLEESNK